MKSAKSVRPQDVTGPSDNYLMRNTEDVVRYSSAMQGNTATPRGTQKLAHKHREYSRVGGTNNLARAMFGMDGKKLCKIARNPLDEHVWQNGVMVRTRTAPTVTHTEVVPPASISMGTILRRAERLEISPVEYCNMIGYVPNDAEIAEMVALYV